MIYITQNFTKIVEDIKRERKLVTIIDSGSREFLVEHAKEAIERAYITTSKLETIVLISPK